MTLLFGVRKVDYEIFSLLSQVERVFIETFINQEVFFECDLSFLVLFLFLYFKIFKKSVNVNRTDFMHFIGIASRRQPHVSPSQLLSANSAAFRLFIKYFRHNF